MFRKIFSSIVFLLFLMFVTSVVFASSSPEKALSNSIDHSVFSDLLKKFVNKRGSVDYKSLKRDKEALNRLSSYVSDLMQIDGLNLEPAEERMAYWLNLYNALVIQAVLKYYPIPSVLQISHFFDEPRYEIKSFPKEKLSLLDIEAKVFVERFNDPRVHLAKVNAAIGSPPLFQEAYQAVTLDKQLESATMTFLNDPSKIYYDPKKSTLYVSPLFLWFDESFEQWAISNFDFIRKRIAPLPLLTKFQFSGFDWRLNDVKYR